jgi:hypothetical protein
MSLKTGFNSVVELTDNVTNTVSQKDERCTRGPFGVTSYV